MGFTCNICNEHAQEKVNKLTTQIRKVIYNTPCQDITSYNNSDKITTGSEIVKEINCCIKCFNKHLTDIPEVIEKEKQVYHPKVNIKIKERQYKRTSSRNDNEFFEDESAEKYNEEV